MTKLTLIKQSW